MVADSLHVKKKILQYFIIMKEVLEEGPDVCLQGN